MSPKQSHVTTLVAKKYVSTKAIREWVVASRSSSATIQHANATNCKAQTIVMNHPGKKLALVTSVREFSYLPFFACKFSKLKSKNDRQTVQETEVTDSMPK